MLTLAGIYFLYSPNGATLASLCLFFLAGLTRSNGSLNFGFVAYLALESYLGELFYSRFKNTIQPGRFFKLILSSIFDNLSKSTSLVAKLLLQFGFLFTPFVVYQYYIFKRFCQKNNYGFHSIPQELVDYARDNNYRLSFEATNNTAEWCHYKLPISYSFIQAEYWKVGLLRYWQIRQIPNFLLASPILYLGFASVKDYFNSMPNASRLYDLFGLIDIDAKDTVKVVPRKFEHNKKLFPFALHLIALMASSVLVMHVQVKSSFLIKLKIKVKTLSFFSN
jgi:phosphatidylinositol glycan class V